jgi:FdhE protein
MIERLVRTTEIEPVLQRLDGLSAEHPELADACAYYRRLLPILVQAREAVDPLALDPGEAQEKIDRGEPVLRGEELRFFTPPAESLFFQVYQAVAGDDPPQGPIKGKTIGRLLRQYMDGDCSSIENTASRLGMDGARLQVILQNTLKPFLHVWREALMPGVDVSTWQKGDCPFCGSLPLLAELRGPERARHLRCGLCGADWPFPRLQCVTCGNTEAASLGILQPEGGLQRISVQTCRVCHGFLKMVISVDPIPADLLPVEDLATLSLELIAGSRGYVRPG